MSERDLFIAAIQITDPAERRAWLDRECGSDTGLRQRIDVLLQAFDQAGSLLDNPAVVRQGQAEAATEARGDAASEGPGAVIGPYKLLEQLGEGGMGVVYLAEQEQPVKRRVALKIIKAGMDSRRVIARFEQERQALALMDHPNIAKVLDAGTTEGSPSPCLPFSLSNSGRPYFVMELVKGLPITQYCDQERLTPKERLDLFIPVCQAVQHAHQKGIIHRDIKPSNVMVALYDGKPVPKVIDFGVAKATGRSLAERTLHTEVGMLVGTLEYMAPEQAEVNNLDIDTRADIYSLGVLLYELLTGSPPFTGKQLRTAGYDGMMRMIREVEPPKPSTKLSSSDELPSIAANRKLEPKTLRRLVTGELDWIAMKCLEKERGRRYETANGLAMDVQRYLADEPVAAGPPSATYRLKKFVRRNRGAVVAVSFVLLALVGGVIGTTWGLIRAEAARKAEAERAKGEETAKEMALKRLGQLEKGNEILDSIFNSLDPMTLEKEDKPLRTLLGERLDRAVAQLQGEAVGDPVTVSKLQNTLGNALFGLGYAEKAIPLWIEAKSTVSTHLGPDHPGTLSLMYNLGMAYSSAGKLKLALPLLEETLKLRKVKLGPDHPDTLTTMTGLALAYMNAGKLDLALPLYEETLKLCKTKLGPDHPTTLAAMAGLALAYMNAGKLDLALPLYEETLTRFKAELGPDHPATLISMNRLAMGYQAAGKLDLALPLYEETLKLCKTKLGPDHPTTLAAMNGLASAYKNVGKLDLALPLYEETLKLHKAKLGSDHPDTLRAMNGLASAYKNVGKLDLALPLYEETLKLHKAKLGSDHPDTLRAMNDLASAYMDAGKLDLALPLYEETLTRIKAKLGPDHPNTSTIMSNLAAAYRAAGKFDVALPLFEESMTLMKAKLGPDHPRTLNSMNNLAWGYSDAGKLDLAVPLFEKTLNLMKANLGAGHADTLNSMNGLATAYRRAGKLDLAGPLFQQAADGVERLKFLDYRAGRIIDSFSEFQEQLQQFSQAEAWRRKWLAATKETAGPESAPYGRALGALGANLVMQKKDTDAEPILRESLAILEKKELDRWNTSRVKSLLGAALLGQEKYSEAESALLQGYEGLMQREEKIPEKWKVHLTEAVERLVQLYDAWGKPGEAEKWRAKLPKKTGDGDPPTERSGQSNRIGPVGLNAKQAPSPAQAGPGARSASLGKQDREAFLGEVMVIGQYFGHAPRSKHEHGPTVGQAVTLVGPGLVQGESSIKVGTGLWEYIHVGVAAHVVDESRGFGPPIGTEGGKMAQYFAEDLVGRHQTNGPELLAERRNGGMERVAREDQRDPIKRVCEVGERHERITRDALASRIGSGHAGTRRRSAASPVLQEARRRSVRESAPRSGAELTPR
jgi:serine/threonine protein kinase/Tfp pilus assembly protein PilF